jgi:hypothetical protein
VWNALGLFVCLGFRLDVYMEEKIIVLYLIFTLFAFGGIYSNYSHLLTFFQQLKKVSKKAVPQVPGGLIFRKYLWWVQQISWPANVSAGRKYFVGWNGAENRGWFGANGGYNGNRMRKRNRRVIV